MIGRETKTWNNEVCSLRISIEFTDSDVNSITPGMTTAWGRNISATYDLGREDTAYFALDSLDAASHIQYGEGHFYDAHTGEDNTGEPYAFDFDIEVWHRNSADSSKPYERYQDNEGIVAFYLPWGNKTLHFRIHFAPDYERDGEIREDGPGGVVRVAFTHNEKSGAGTGIVRPVYTAKPENEQVGLPPVEKGVLIGSITIMAASYIFGIIDSYRGAQRYNAKLNLARGRDIRFDLAADPFGRTVKAVACVHF